MVSSAPSEVPRVSRKPNSGAEIWPLLYRVSGRGGWPLDAIDGKRDRRDR